MPRILSALLMATALSAGSVALTTPASAQEAATAQTADISVFYGHNPDSTRTLDYTAWSDVLGDIVLRVPPSTREPARGRPVQTGTRIFRGNATRYRYEANRVVYHLMDEPYEEAVRDFRIAMEALPGRIDFTNLNRDEQLAYWLNLYNATVIENILARYPETHIDRTRAAGTNERLFDAKILNVNGVPLSLNDIRLHIVYRLWDDPRVMYGFHSGTIGSPSILRSAYTGNSVWAQLDRNAEEFINSLRGVERTRDTVRVSAVYDEGAHFFPDYDADLRAHLATYANAATAAELDNALPIEADVETWLIADMTNGVIGCGGGGSPVQVSQPIGTSRVNLNNLDCYTMPTTGRILMEHVIERRIEMYRNGELGIVRTIDLPTTDDGTPPPAEAQGEDAPIVNLAPTFGGQSTSRSGESQPEG